MANYQTNLAFSIPAGDGLGCAARLLFGARERWSATERRRPHVHEFWQMELATQGRLGLATEAGRRLLETGSMVIIPPGVAHAFIYDATGGSFVTLKFDVTGLAEEPRGIVRAEEPMLLRVGSVLAELCSGPDPVPPRQVRLIEGILAGLVAACFLPSPVEFDPYPRLVREAVQLVRTRGGGRVTIKELATDLGCSAVHLSTQFRVATGRTLKSFIDGDRLARARDMLRYADLNISDVGNRLGFADIFAFSRFFKRQTGLSPRAFLHQPAPQSGLSSVPPGRCSRARPSGSWPVP
jgi:AraC family transcriptional activator of pobA